MPDARHALFNTRLRNQALVASRLSRCEDVVAWLGAVQSQDYTGAKWALGLRAPGITDADVDRAFDAGAILRTHALRPTWHFVAPADIRWILALSGPRVHRLNAHYYRRSELDDHLLSRSRRILERTLEDGTPRTRSEIAQVLARSKIAASGQRLAYVMMHAELDGVICSGPRRGKQFTYALLDQRAPGAREMPREQAIATLTRRYLSSHGPATVRDFAWWSGLTMADAKTGFETIRGELSRRDLDDRTYWFVESASSGENGASRTARSPAFLLPNYDEFLIAYKDRDLARRDPAVAVRPPAIDPFPHHIVADRRLAGSWRRAESRAAVIVEAALYVDTPRARDCLTAPAARLSEFLGRPVLVS